MAKIIWHDTLDSTNAEALRRIGTLENCSVLAAVRQTAGRGQRGNRWLSAPGENLTFSLVLKHAPDALPVRDAFRLNLVASVAVRDFLRDEGCEALVKWPNDLYVRQRKICGILVENGLGSAGFSHSVIGIGININQRVFGDLANATSLFCETGRTLELKPALEKVVSCLEGRLQALWNADAYALLREDYMASLFQAKRPAPYRDLLTGKLFTGILEDVGEDGRAVVTDCGDGSRKRFAFKELGYIL